MIDTHRIYLYLCVTKLAQIFVLVLNIQIVQASMAYWLRVLTLNHISLTTVSLSLAWVTSEKDKFCLLKAGSFSLSCQVFAPL